MLVQNLNMIPTFIPKYPDPPSLLRRKQHELNLYLYPYPLLTPVSGTEIALDPFSLS